MGVRYNDHPVLALALRGHLCGLYHERFPLTGDMAIARINGKMISWALRRSGASLESLATPKISLARLKAWETSEEFPSEGDAKKLADKLGIAYPMLYMKEVPPEEPIKIPDRRTVDGSPLRCPSLNLLEVLDKTKARQEWYRSELPSPPEKLDFVGRFNLRVSPVAIAADMRKSLGIDAAVRANRSEERRVGKECRSR